MREHNNIMNKLQKYFFSCREKKKKKIGGGSLREAGRDDLNAQINPNRQK